METAAMIAATLLGVVMVFQIGLGLGAPWGAAAWGGRYPGVLPTGPRIASGVAGFVVYPLLTDAIASAAGLVSHPFGWVPGATGMWVLAGFFAVGAVLNLVSRSRPERWWAPVSLGVAICGAVIARGL